MQFVMELHAYTNLINNLNKNKEKRLIVAVWPYNTVGYRRLR